MSKNIKVPAGVVQKDPPVHVQLGCQPDEVAGVIEQLKRMVAGPTFFIGITVRPLSGEVQVVSQGFTTPQGVGPLPPPVLMDVLQRVRDLVIAQQQAQTEAVAAKDASKNGHK